MDKSYNVNTLNQWLYYTYRDVEIILKHNIMNYSSRIMLKTNKKTWPLDMLQKHQYALLNSQTIY